MPTEITLTPSPEKKRRYELPGVGSLQYARWSSRAAAARAVDGVVLKFAAQRNQAAAEDPVGNTWAAAVTGSNHVTKIDWALDKYELAANAADGLTAYVLAAGDRELAVIQPTGPRSATVGVGDVPITPALLLFATFVALHNREKTVGASAVVGA